MDLALHVRRVLQKERMIQFGDTVVCAVSGGPDSMALLHVMARLADEFGFAVIAAHVNHGFREAESDNEAETVKRFAEQLGLSLESAKVDAPGYARSHRMNAQAAARELRYRFLLETAARRGASAVALAHHLDDQAETVFMNMISGASLKGLSGMAPQRSERNLQLIRPLLRIVKEAIMAYVSEQGIPYCLDSSNTSRKYGRNRIRLDIMPQLLAFNPRLPYTLGQMADVLRDEEVYMEEQTALLADQIVKRESGCCQASRNNWTSIPIALQRRLIHLILYYLAGDPRFPDHAKIESIRSAIAREAPPSLSLDVGACIRFERSYDRLVWRRVEAEPSEKQPEPMPFSYAFTTADTVVDLPEAGGVLYIDVAPYNPSQDDPFSRNEAWFDADLLQQPLIARSRKNGDRMDLLGLTGTKKVKDMFIDLKIEPQRRSRIPVIVDESRALLWIPGVHRSRHALVSENTVYRVRMQFIPE